MGWMRTILLGDIGNRLDIADTEDSIRALRAKQRRESVKIQRKNIEIGELKDEVAELKLATQALTRFLISKGDIDREAFEAFIEAVDAEDGVIDGKITEAPSDSAQRRSASKPLKPKIPDGTFRTPDALGGYSIDE
ncbi:MAG: hypothetical protein ACI8XO_000930 [Verrucomicrobiales bacterium]|jgi:hypothetical protein